MTAYQDDASTPASRPARGRLGRPAAPPAAPVSSEAADVAQGQAAAVLGALARMQLRLDVLSREQTETFARLLARLDQLESTLLLRSDSTPPAAAPPAMPWHDEPPAQMDETPTGEEPATSWQDSDR